MATDPTEPCVDYPELKTAASSPRRISVDGVDYSGHSLSELIAYARFCKTNDGSACAGFRSSKLIRQQASPPSALGVHLGRSWPGGRVW